MRYWINSIQLLFSFFELEVFLFVFHKMGIVPELRMGIDWNVTIYKEFIYWSTFNPRPIDKLIYKQSASNYRFKNITIARGSAAVWSCKSWLKQKTNQNQDRMGFPYSHCKRLHICSSHFYCQKPVQVSSRPLGLTLIILHDYYSCKYYCAKSFK
jgi:hypothetical protein